MTISRALLSNLVNGSNKKWTISQKLTIRWLTKSSFHCINILWKNIAILYLLNIKLPNSIFLQICKKINLSSCVLLITLFFFIILHFEYDRRHTVQRIIKIDYFMKRNLSWLRRNMVHTDRSASQVSQIFTKNYRTKRN